MLVLSQPPQTLRHADEHLLHVIAAPLQEADRGPAGWMLLVQQPSQMPCGTAVYYPSAHC
jgi:hypothetical protein